MNRLYLTTILIGFWFVTSAKTAEKSHRFQVTHVPSAAYVGERTTLVLAGRPGTELSVTLNTKQLAREEFKEDRLELNFVFDQPGRLELVEGEKKYRFELLLPGDEREVRSVDGFLYLEKVPVILLLPHRHPPKHDRTWELVKVTGNLLGMGNRPGVDDAVVLGGDFLAGGFSTAGWLHQRLDATGLELTTMVTALQSLKPADLLVLAPSSFDLEHGVTPVDYRMRLEWLLQHVDRKRFPQVAVVWPPLSKRILERYPEMPRFLRLATAGNRVPLVVPGTVTDRKPIRADVWLTAVKKRLQKRMVFAK